MPKKPRIIVVDARIRRSSTGRPVDRFLHYAQSTLTEDSYIILTEANDPWEPTNPQFKKVPVNYRQYSFNPLQQASYALKLYRLKPDLVFFTQTGQQPLFYFGHQITFTHDLTMLRFVRAGRLPQWLHVVRMAGYRLLFRSGNKKASRIIVPSRYVQQDLAKNYPFTKNKSTVIYESGDAAAPAQTEQITNINKPFIMHVGSPFPHKNIERLVEAFTLLHEQHPNLQLVLAGKREFYFNQLEKLIHSSPASSATKNIIIPGFVTDAQLRWLYENAACYVLPSLSEGFGLPGLEAMTYGTPLVSSSATCLPEVYGPAAVYFDPTSPADMAEKINSVLTDENLRKELIKLGKEQIKKYSWERMTEGILDCITEVVEA